ncbi:MAG: GNAT family N-acetyltransferase [Firmicutes bacterium]|nr:GNAT family N-acetyltransferase [Bacillota bacterium]
MNYNFVPMKKEFANEITYNWKYNDIYSFYDMTADEEDLEEFLDEDSWEGRYFAVLDENDELVGYYSFNFDDGIMWIGFGLKPGLTGKGYGPDFVNAGIDFGINEFGYKENYIMLAVATFNKRAIKAYEKIGFQFIEKYIQKTNGGGYEFIRMRKNI